MPAVLINSVVIILQSLALYASSISFAVKPMSRITIILVSLALFTSIVQAEVLTMEVAITEALTNNPTIQAALSSSKSLQHRVSPAGSLPDPKVSLDLMNYPLGGFERDRFDMTGNQLSLTQMVPFPGKRAELESSANHKARAEASRVNALKREVVRDVKSAYLAVFKAQESGQIITSRYSIVDKALASARDRYATGKVSQAEVLAIEVELTDLQNDKLMIERDLRAERATLAQLMGRSQHEGRWKVADIKRTPIKSLLAFTSTHLDLNSHPRIRTLNEETKRAEAEKRYSELNLLPDFEFSVGYTERQAVEAGRGDDFVSARVGITVPLWAESKQRLEQEAAREELKKAKQLLREEEVHLAHEIEVAKAALELAEKQLTLFESKTRSLTKQAVDVAQASYSTGEVDYRTVLELANKYARSELTILEALVSREQRVAELEALLATDALEDAPL